MRSHPSTELNRRQFLQLCFWLSAPLVIAACSRQQVSDSHPDTPTQSPPTSGQLAEGQSATTQAAPTQPAQAEVLAPTPACSDDDDLTPPQTEGPFYSPDSPERTSLLETGMVGTKILLTGYVLSTDCRPISGALLDFWHADDEGVYDNVGYRLRGHQFANEAGQYHLETIVPGLYPGRTRHFHVKVQAPNRPVLTTQLYLPGEPQNARDAIFNPDLLIDVQDAEEGKKAAFNFVLDIH